MTLSISEPLASRLASLEREPLVHILSESFTADKPFAGRYFNESAVAENHPEAVTSGDVVVFLTQRSTELVLTVTDEDRTTWTEIVINDASINDDTTDLSLCVLANGNIGALQSTTAGKVWSMIVSVTGTIISAKQEVFDSVDDLTGVTSCTMGNGLYRMVYVIEDGVDYRFWSRTSSDFITWSSSSQITFTGLDLTKPIRNPHMVYTAAAGLDLFFDRQDDIKEDGTELTNIYYIGSGDNGATWSAAVKVTDYDKFSVTATHPYVAKRTDGSITLVYTEHNSVLRIGKGSDNWGGTGCYGTVPRLHYDSTTDRIIADMAHVGAGTKWLCSVNVIDADSWSVIRNYTDASSPAYNEAFSHEHVWFDGNHGKGQYSAVKLRSGAGFFILDHVNQTIVEYWFRDSVPYSYQKNITASDIDDNILGVWIDDANSRCYVVLTDNYLYDRHFVVGYVNIGEQPGVGEEFTWTKVIPIEGDKFVTGEIDNDYAPDGFSIDVAADLIILHKAANAPSTNYDGKMWVFQLSTGILLHELYHTTTTSMHRQGAYTSIHANGHIYFSFPYYSTFEQSGRRGLGDLNLNTGSISYHRPTFSSRDDYGIHAFVKLNDGRIGMTCLDGIAVFNPNDGTWFLYDDTVIPGMFDAGDTFYDIDYDEGRESFIVGVTEIGTDYGVLVFSELGAYAQSQYVDAVYSGSWGFGSINPLTIGQRDYKAAVTVAPDNIMWANWIRDDDGEESSKWDNESISLALSDLLVTDSGVTVRWRIDGATQLSFSLSHGHLFDPGNSLSTWNTFLKKGRLIKLQFGEMINDTSYMVDQGEFVVDETRLSYARGRYPDIEVTCIDKSVFLEHHKIEATEYWSEDNPEEIIRDLLINYGNVLSADINIPTFDTSHQLFCQFLDEYLKDSIQEILDHFEYFQYYDMDGNYTARRVDHRAVSSHVYTGAEVIDYSPDDSFSDYTNRVSVKGESRELLEVIHDEEMVAALAGTMGWWGGTEVHTVYFSEDAEKTCRDPRLKIITSIQEFSLFLLKNSDATEEITYIDPEGKYCEVTITSANFTWLIILNIVALLAIGTAALMCDYGKYCGAMIMAATVLLSLLLYALGAIANYAYEIYAKPLGSERQTIQCLSDDEDMQTYLNGTVVEETIDDPYCYYVSECCRVASYELGIVQAQRRRVQFKKIAHLQDEVGDVITIDHPFSGVPVNIFITDLSRTLKKPDRPGGKRGGFIDTINGWRQAR